MEIKTKTVSLRVIEATPGHLLYRSDEPLESAYFSKKVYLGVNDSKDNFTEITQEEAVIIAASRAAATENPAEETTTTSTQNDNPYGND